MHLMTGTPQRKCRSACSSALNWPSKTPWIRGYSQITKWSLTRIGRCLNRFEYLQSTYGPQREKTYLLTCTSNDDSNQPAHPRSLIRIYVVRMMKLCIFCYPKCVHLRFWSNCANTQADLNPLGAHVWKYIVARCGLYALGYIFAPCGSFAIGYIFARCDSSDFFSVKATSRTTSSNHKPKLSSFQNISHSEMT